MLTHHEKQITEMEETLERLNRIRRHAIALLRLAETVLGIPSSLRPEIGKPKEGK